MNKVLQSIFILLLILTTSKAAEETKVIASPAGSQLVYYNLEKGTSTTYSATNWDIQFMTGAVNGGIRINDAKGVNLYLVPQKNIDDFGKSLDTTGFNSWQTLYNSDSTWNLGAFNMGLDGYESGTGDYGWGAYDPQTHFTIGNKLFVIKIGTTNSVFKQIAIVEMASGEYTFKYANLDGTSLKEAKVRKSDFPGRNYIGYSLLTDTIITKEPLSAEWDLVYGRYVSIIPDGGGNLLPYTLVGFLNNSLPTAVAKDEPRKFVGVKAAQIDGVSNITTKPSEEQFTSNISEIGSDWKNFNGASFEIIPKRAYVVAKTDNMGKIQAPFYEIIFRSYTGGASVSSTFTQEKLELTSVEGELVDNIGIYPNIITNADNAQLIMTSKADGSVLNIEIVNSLGSLIERKTVVSNDSFIIVPIETANLAKGMYFVNISGKSLTKFIVQ